MAEFEIAVLSPPRAEAEEVLVAAGKASGLPIVDHCYVRDAAALRNAVLGLCGHLGGYVGIRTNLRSLERVASVLESMGARVDLILLSGESDGDGGACLSTSIENLRRFGKRIFCEVISQEEALEAVKAGVDGLVAKGNEAAGRVGSETSFVLLQRLCSSVAVPVWAYGGIGPHGATACRVAGAAGIVLQDEIALAEECSIPEPLRSRIAAMDGTETICLGELLGRRYRVHRQEGASSIRELQQLEMSGAEPGAFVARLDEILERSDGQEILRGGSRHCFCGAACAPAQKRGRDPESLPQPSSRQSEDCHVGACDCGELSVCSGPWHPVSHTPGAHDPGERCSRVCRCGFTGGRIAVSGHGSSAPSGM